MNTNIENSEPQSGSRRRRGHVARLPKILRDKINTMLDDGATYSEIVTELEKSTEPVLPYPITVDHLTRWVEGGYQDYLRDESWRERLDVSTDRYLEVGMRDGAKLAAGGLYAAASKICQLMDELSACNGDEKDAENFARISNALSRLSRSILSLQQYRDHVAQKKSELEAAAKLTDHKGGLPPEIVKQIQIAIAGL